MGPTVWRICRGGGMVWGLYARRWQSPVDEVLRVQLICYNPGLLLCESI